MIDGFIWPIRILVLLMVSALLYVFFRRPSAGSLMSNTAFRPKEDHEIFSGDHSPVVEIIYKGDTETQRFSDMVIGLKSFLEKDFEIPVEIDSELDLQDLLPDGIVIDGEGESNGSEESARTRSGVKAEDPGEEGDLEENELSPDDFDDEEVGPDLDELDESRMPEDLKNSEGNYIDIDDIPMQEL